MACGRMSGMQAALSLLTCVVVGLMIIRTPAYTSTTRRALPTAPARHPAENRSDYAWTRAEKAHWIVEQSKRDGTLTDRLKHYNEAIDRMRSDALRTLQVDRSESELLTLSQCPVLVMRGDDEALLHRLSSFDGVTAAVLPWIVRSVANRTPVWDSLNDSSNLLVRRYFAWTGDDRVCSFIAEKEGIAKSECGGNKSHVDYETLDPTFLKWTKSHNGSRNVDDIVFSRGRPYRLTPVATI